MHPTHTRTRRDVSPTVTRLTPTPDVWWTFRRLAHLPYAILFDSAAPDSRFGRYSYLAASPFAVLVSRRGQTTELRADDPSRLDSPYHAHDVTDDPPLVAAKERFGAWGAPRVRNLPPFQGGAAGYFAYDLARTLERIPSCRWDEFSGEDMVLGFYDWVIAFDHVESCAHLVAHGFPETNAALRSRLAKVRNRELSRALKVATPPPAAPLPDSQLATDELAPSWPVSGPPGLVSNFSHESYLAAVRQAIEYIHAGDVFQVNLAQRLLSPAEISSDVLYERLRSRNPAPFASYFHTGDRVIASSSPEQFLSLERGRVVTRPIKGTRPRGYSQLDDPFQGAALIESEKDRSENVMIVDLLRNDLSKVSEPGSVEVPRLFEIERHPTVYHLVSEVRSQLRGGLGAFDLLEASFPGGSITGAPKVRAMEIIAELEPTSRGAYCGSMGWMSFAGDMGTNILIRTVTQSRGWLQLPVGGGIVALSSPEAEYRETLSKAAGMLRALVT